MFATLAAVLFGLALLLTLLGQSLGVLTPTFLTLAGLLCVAVQLAPSGSSRRGWRRR